jgi:hypothetical protein
VGTRCAGWVAYRRWGVMRQHVLLGSRMVFVLDHCSWRRRVVGGAGVGGLTVWEIQQQFGLASFQHYDGVPQACLAVGLGGAEPDVSFVVH